MPRTRAQMMELVRNLIAQYSEFQRRRPDPPQGDLRNLSQSELEELVTAFQLNAAPWAWVIRNDQIRLIEEDRRQVGMFTADGAAAAAAEHRHHLRTRSKR